MNERNPGLDTAGHDHTPATQVAEAFEDAARFAGTPDELQRLWTPHRVAYIQGEGKPPTSSAGKQCPFCAAPEKTDEDALIVHRGAHAYVILNLFPYNAGHLLICPYRHVSDYTDLTEAEYVEIAQFTRTSMRVIRAVSAPAGFNLGMNQGAVAGAGIAAHLHQHVVPRWAGDANFLPIIGRTKALPFLLGQTRDMFAAAWPEDADAEARTESAKATA